MESNYSNRDFEQHIKENADQYRMFPSEKVWKGVHSALHTRRKWYGFGLAFLLLVTGGAVTWVMTVYPVSKKQNETALKTGSTDKSLAEQHAISSADASTQVIKDLLPFNREPAQYPENRAGNGTDRVISEIPAASSEDVNSVPDSPTDALSQQHPASRLEREPTIVNAIIIKNTGLPQAGPGEPVAALKTSTSLPLVATRREASPADNYPLTIESITNSYSHQRISRRISWQIFITPTVSYRKLSVNKSYDNLSDNNSPAAANYPFATITDVNNAVTHKPDLGMQLGVSARYSLTRNLRLRGGLQFNINRYDIKALAYNGEIATINLSPGAGSNTSVSTWTRYRNYSGYRSDWLKNFYFSVSAPIGAELTLFGNNKTSVGIAGTVQPTYILSDRAYMISTDYKNYAKIPWLIRNMNVNSSFEAFVNYTRGKTKWQIGPQVRYQMLSSFKNKYPVKENLFDFGLKLGLTLNE